MAWDRRHLIDIETFSREDFEYIFELTDGLLPRSGIESPVDRPIYAAQSRIMTLWFERPSEPSTRTYGSFETAMARLGGVFKRFDEGDSSMSKGESIEHTTIVLSQQTDIIADRHRDPDHVRIVAQYSRVPVINCGNGSHQHPTQTVLDLYTIKKKRGRVDGTTIAVLGDLKHGRTVHSLCRGVDRFDNMKIVGVYPHGCELPEEFKPNRYEGREIDMGQLNRELADIAPDVVYVTRPQLERGTHAQRYVIDEHTLEILPQHALIMHPLPIDSKNGPEISAAVDRDPRAVYFKQSSYGVPVRMALIATVLEIDGLLRRDYLQP